MTRRPRKAPRSHCGGRDIRVRPTHGLCAAPLETASVDVLCAGTPSALSIRARRRRAATARYRDANRSSGLAGAAFAPLQCLEARNDPRYRGFRSENDWRNRCCMQSRAIMSRAATTFEGNPGRRDRDILLFHYHSRRYLHRVSRINCETAANGVALPPDLPSRTSRLSNAMRTGIAKPAGSLRLISHSRDLS